MLPDVHRLGGVDDGRPVMNDTDAPGSRLRLVRPIFQDMSGYLPQTVVRKTH